MEDTIVRAHGVVAGLGIFNTVAVRGKSWATVYGALDCLKAGDKAEIVTDGPAISTCDTRLIHGVTTHVHWNRQIL
ncbi:MAG: hypothetical protein OXF54_09725 [Caldilineaceae bacterium]|nr:hypothetical protein [Caldilineaceae bacterium]